VCSSDLNRVEGLHREQFGKLTLGDLALGEWCYLDDTQKRLAQTLD
jgi:16S rRNA U516 pseudouridylate synthase RsuA-like enzyme